MENLVIFTSGLNPHIGIAKLHGNETAKPGFTN